MSWSRVLVLWFLDLRSVGGMERCNWCDCPWGGTAGRGRKTVMGCMRG